VDQAPIDPAAAGFDEAAIKDRRRRAVIGIAVAVFVLLLVLFMTWKFLQRPVQTVDAGTESASIADNSSAIATDSGLSTVPPETATATESVVPSEPTGADTTVYEDPGAVMVTPGAPSSDLNRDGTPATKDTPAPSPTPKTTPKTTPAPTPVTTPKAAVTYSNTALVLSPASPNGANGWYKSRPLIKFTPTGRKTYYRWKTWGSYTRFKGSFYALDGDHTFQWYSYKPDGTRQAQASKRIAVDRTTPSKPGNFRIISNVNGSAVVAWNASSDSHSGVARYEVVDSNGTKKAASTGLSATIGGLTPATPHTFSVRAFDAAGNKSLNSNSVSLAPSTLVLTTPANPDGANGWFKTPPTVTLVSNESGVSYYAWDAQVGYTTYSSPFTMATPGAHSLRYYSQNSDGQAETEKSTPIKLDSVAPPAPPAPSVVASGPAIMHLSWSTVTDVVPGSGLDHYDVLDFRSNGEYSLYRVAPSGSNPQTFTVTTTDPDAFTGHEFQIVAVDAAGNRSSGGLTKAAASATTNKTKTKVSATKRSFVRPTFDDPTPGLISVPISNPPAAPPGYVAIPDTCFDVTPGGPFTGTATVVLNYNPANLSNPDSEIRMMHYTGGQWVDITTEVDRVGHRVSGATSEFSPFGLFEDPPSVPTPASSWESLVALGGFGLLLAVWSLRRRTVSVSA
jgi:hypothetical protein